MPPCTMCETPVPAGRDVCLACGTHVSQAPTARAGPGQARVALEAALRASAAEEAKGVDVAVAKRLIEASERAHGEGRESRALDLARAARRAVEIAHRKARVEADLSRAELRVREARDTGVDTFAAERNLGLARKATEGGEFEDAERLLSRASIKALEVRREKHFHSLIDTAAEHVAHAKERGGEVDHAEEALAKARQAASMDAFAEARKHLERAVAWADDARKYSRAETFLVKGQAEMDAARKVGADVTQAREVLAQAREALRKGVYADVQKFAQLAGVATREARRVAQSEFPIKVAEREVRKEERRGGEVAPAAAQIDAARAALQERDFPRSRAIAKEALDLTREAAILRRLSESLASLSLDSEDLRKIGADSAEFDRYVKDAKEAVAAREVTAGRRLIAQARHAAESAREARYREVVRTTIEMIVERAGVGRVDAIKARELLKEVEDAIAGGQSVDVQKLVAERLETKDLERIKILTEMATRVKERLLELRRADIDVSGAEEKIGAARAATDSGRYEEARTLLTEVDDIVRSLQEALRASAEEMLARARDTVEKVRAEKVAVPDAVRILRNAEESFAQGKHYETLEFARIAGARAERALTRHKEETAKHDEASKKEFTERLHTLRSRMDAVQKEIDEVESEFTDVTAARDALGSALRALELKKLEEAEAYVSAAEEITKGIKTGLKNGAEQSLNEARVLVAESKAQGLDMATAEQLLANAEEAMNGELFAKVLHLVQAIEAAVGEAKKARVAEEQKRVLERAKKASERFLRVRRLLEDLQKADIDIQGADDGLRNAERALQRRSFDEVDLLLGGIEETALALKAELTSAAKEILDRARTRIKKAKDLGLDVGEPEGILVNAEAYFGRGEYDDAVEFARVAEQKADALIRSHDEAIAAEERSRRDAARGSIDRIKRLVDDLSRADIEILGAKEVVARAEAALDARQYEEVEKEIAGVSSDAESVAEGLKVAAEDLVAMADRTIEQAKAEGYDVPRAEHVLLNAQDAIKDSRFVEAIEYKKVIEDIVQDARRQKGYAALEVRIQELRAEIEASEKVGADVRITSDLLRRAEEDIRVGRFDDLESYARQIADSLAAAKRVHVSVRLDGARKLVQEGAGLGMETTELEELHRKAAAAAEEGDAARMDSLIHDLEERVLEHKRAVLLRKAADEIGSIQGMITQAERVGMEIDEVKSLLDDAQRAMEAGRYESLDRMIADSKAALHEARTRHFADRYEAKLRGIQTMIASAKRVGANVAEAERILGEAEDALRRNDISMADILVKQAEISTGIQVQNFIKNRYPNLVITLPTKGLQANVWNKYAFQVENKGKLSARNVDIQIKGDVEVKGLKPIPEIGVDESKLVEIGLKPTADGDVPLDVQVFYQRYFDENKYELKDQQAVRVERQGTYLVEDIFLIHLDGRLIAHQSRKFREEIDEDIFSGMLTVVQDFVKDSFRQRTKVGLKRLDFGDSKILIERSPHTFLAAVLVGDEPALLPLYMIEVLKEVEEKFGPVLEKWSGMLHEVQGVDELIRKLIFVTQVQTAEMGALAQSPVTETARALEAARMSGQDVSEVEALLSQATDNLERSLESAWAFVSEAKTKATEAQGRVRERMQELLLTTGRTVDELRVLGADVSQAELLLRDAQEAFNAENYERVREIAENVRSSLERAKTEVASRKVEMDLASLVSAIRENRAQGVDVREAESLLTRIEDAIQRKDYRRLDEYLKRASDSVNRNRKSMVVTQARAEMDKIRRMVTEAKEFGADAGDTEHYLDMAEKALRSDNAKDLELLVDRARIEARQRIEMQLKDRYPRLFLGIPTEGLQADAWNRVLLEIANKGNWAAKDLDIAVLGDFDVTGLEKIPKVEANERRIVELGVKPREAGATSLDVRIGYRRPLDESRYESTDSKEVRVEPSGTYLVTDALTFHKDGALLAHESREYRDAPGRTEADALVRHVREFITTAFARGAHGLKRTKFKDATVLVEPGPSELLVAVVHGAEPPVLPLYMIEVLKQIEDTFGRRLATWSGDVAGLEGLADLVRKLLFVTEAPEASLGPLATSPMAQAAKLAERGVLTGEGGQDFLAWARSLLETEDFPKASGLVDRITEAVTAPASEIARQVQEAAMAHREAGALEVTDEQMALYVDMVRQVLEAVANAKAKAGIERYWPVKRIAVKASHQTALDAITAFRKIIVGQSLAKELDIVPMDETWRGMKVTVQVDREAVSAAYRLWARKIEVMLKSQDPWKIKAGLARAEYVVGIDGQRVRIDPHMVTFAESLPDHVILEPFDNGVVYLDAEMTPEILGEGYAKELVNIIKDIRKDLKLGESDGIETRIRASENSVRLLRSWRDFISRETNSTDVRFVREQVTEGYIVEASLGEENFLVSVKSSEA